jgi:hypothetical protein
MSVILIIPSTYPRAQISLWIVCEVLLAGLTIWAKPFKDKKFRIRTNIIAVLFVILSITILVLIQTKERHKERLSLVVTGVSCVVLGIDMILSCWIMVAEIYNAIKKKKKKKTGVTKDILTDVSNKPLSNVKGSSRVNIANKLSYQEGGFSKKSKIVSKYRNRKGTKSKYKVHISNTRIKAGLGEKQLLRDSKKNKSRLGMKYRTVNNVGIKSRISSKRIKMNKFKGNKSKFVSSNNIDLNTSIDLDTR